MMSLWWCFCHSSHIPSSYLNFYLLYKKTLDVVREKVVRVVTFFLGKTSNKLKNVLPYFSFYSSFDFVVVSFDLFLLGSFHLKFT